MYQAGIAGWTWMYHLTPVWVVVFHTFVVTIGWDFMLACHVARDMAVLSFSSGQGIFWVAI
jgi:hypothetical protein